MAERLQSKRCLVTGAAQGIGLAIARAFAREGAIVLATDMRLDALRAAGLPQQVRLERLDVNDAVADAIELGKHGIRVNCVAPGAIEVERTRQEWPDYAATWSAVTPLGRVGQAVDVANAVLFFADPAANFVTGQTLWVDGGVFTMPNWPYRKVTEA